MLTEDECRALLDSAYQCHYTMLGFRDGAALSLLVYTGIRRQELLGHASLESTSIYLHVDITALQEAVAKHPLRADD